MPTWIYEAIDNISSGKKIHGLVMLELVERGLARYSDNTEVQALTSDGMRLYNEINNGKAVG